MVRMIGWTMTILGAVGAVALGVTVLYGRSASPAVPPWKDALHEGRVVRLKPKRSDSMRIEAERIADGTAERLIVPPPPEIDSGEDPPASSTQAPEASSSPEMSPAEPVEEVEAPIVLPPPAPSPSP